MISKNKINQVAREFKRIENDYLMGIIYNTKFKNLKVDLILPDTLSSEEVILIDCKTNLKSIKDISNHIEYILKVEYNN